MMPRGGAPPKRQRTGPRGGDEVHDATPLRRISHHRVAPTHRTGAEGYVSESSRQRWLVPVVLAALILIGGCATVDGTTPAVQGTTPKEDTKAGIEQWKCGDYFDGCGLFATDCVTLTANRHDGTGEVKFGEIVETTRFQIQGIERRWDWCRNAEFEYDCAFVISVDGTGSYYSFHSSDDGKAKPRDRFKCSKR